MNREYLIIDIALGAEKAEDYDIVLTEEDKKAIEWYKKEYEKAKKEERRIVFFATDMY
ncbi:hypothetical protein [Anaerococcus degeneri]|uniref:Uncharacterized protein n=1 Tax=Anaerococcus degeneri TaxID=361500 RepID=A0ABS7YYY1_9FIRM|nr:hypothetical protein [Anaerococcus degeneri]MBP2016145.1 hypothetical protein [Anaerococcus degeneri]MCA2096650.1 hypothetical protein [Anaerococcus degeneri]